MKEGEGEVYLAFPSPPSPTNVLLISLRELEETSNPYHGSKEKDPKIWVGNFHAFMNVTVNFF